MTPRYLIAYRDRPEGRPRYFGPFVTMTEAESLQRELPAPVVGGASTILPVETLTWHLLPAIKSTILTARKKRLAKT